MLSYSTKIPIMEILAQKPDDNAPLLNVVERGCHERVLAAGLSLGIKDKLSGTYMFSAESWGTLEELLYEALEELDTFMINTMEFRSELQRMFPKAVFRKYDSYVMHKQDYSPFSRQIDGFELVPLDLGWLDFILKHYGDNEFGNEKYISDRILYGPGLGLLTKGGEKAAFVLQHKDGESGPLVVDKRYRRMGLGSDLLRHFNGLLFEKNTVIFGFVEPSNIASAHMMVNNGYRKIDGNVLWVYRMKNGSLYLP